MISLRNNLMALGLLAASTLTCLPAQALPFVGVEAGADGAYFMQRPANAPAFGGTVMARVEAFGFEADGHYTALSDRNYSQLFVRTSILPIPMFTIKPGIGVIQQSLFNAGNPSNALGLGIRAGFAPLLIPITVDGAVDFGIDTTGLAVTSVSAGANLSLIPFTAIHAGLRGYSRGQESFGGPEIGLRVRI